VPIRKGCALKVKTRARGGEALAALTLEVRDRKGRLPLTSDAFSPAQDEGAALRQANGRNRVMPL